jgi:hypothetical protein
MPRGFTGNYFFEFDKGIVIIRHLATSPNEEKICFPLIFPATAHVVRSALLIDLFRFTSIGDLTLKAMKRFKLSRHQGNTITRKKIKSMAKKYISIPAQYLYYYPTLEEGGDSEKEEELGDGVSQSTSTKQIFIQAAKEIVRVRKPRRQKKALPSLANQKSILGFFVGGFSSRKDSSK